MRVFDRSGLGEFMAYVCLIPYCDLLDFQLNFQGRRDSPRVRISDSNLILAQGGRYTLAMACTSVHNNNNI